MKCFYQYNIEFYEDGRMFSKGLLAAENFQEAYEILADYYGVDCIDRIDLQILTTDSVLVLQDKEVSQDARFENFVADEEYQVEAKNV